MSTARKYIANSRLFLSNSLPPLPSVFLLVLLLSRKWCGYHTFHDCKCCIRCSSLFLCATSNGVSEKCLTGWLSYWLEIHELWIQWEFINWQHEIMSNCVCTRSKMCLNANGCIFDHLLLGSSHAVGFSLSNKKPVTRFSLTSSWSGGVEIGENICWELLLMI